MLSSRFIKKSTTLSALAVVVRFALHSLKSKMIGNLLWKGQIQYLMIFQIEVIYIAYQSQKEFSFVIFFWNIDFWSA